MELVVRRPKTYHVSHDTTEELEAAILRDPRVTPAESREWLVVVTALVTRILGRAGMDSGGFLRAGRRTGHGSSPERDYLAVMMSLDPARIAPWFVRRARKSIYLFDAWPAKHAGIVRLVDSWGIQYAFVSSSQAADRLGRLSEHCTVIWIPEGVDPERYRRRPLAERDIDVLQLGRRFDKLHASIEPVLGKAGKSYLYERSRGAIVFPRREEFIDGLARSRVSICMPSSLTHPERAGDIETMTTRYLQSMVSGCLVVGHAPMEMVELFGYNPVVELDTGAADEHLMEILGQYEDYLPLIERNYETVIAGHTWARRWERMSSVLFPAGPQSLPGE